MKRKRKQQSLPLALLGILGVGIVLTSIAVSRPTTFVNRAQEEDIQALITYKPNQKQTTFRRLTPIIPPEIPTGTPPTGGITRIPTAAITSLPDPTRARNPTATAPNTTQPQSPPGDSSNPGGECAREAEVVNCTCTITRHLFYRCEADGRQILLVNSPEFAGTPEEYIRYSPQDNSGSQYDRITKAQFDSELRRLGSACKRYCKQFDKPVLYLYPPRAMQVDVVLEVPGIVIKSIPEYGTGWYGVLAHPDGTLFYKGGKYTDLFYETQVGVDASERNEGFLLQKHSLEADLSPILAAYGLQGREHSEFLEYWVPRLQKEPGPAFFMRVLTWEEKNKVDLVHITPKPDVFIHFLVEFKSVPDAYQYQQQQIPTFIPKRTGFTVVEWGGSVE